jgi:L-alanine-DL-glutamate epimerase-like enolase superfamily enzyme
VPQAVNGELTVPNKPGLGLEFDPEALRKWGV